MKFKTIFLSRLSASAISLCSFWIFSQYATLSELGELGLLLTSATLISASIFEPLFISKATLVANGQPSSLDSAAVAISASGTVLAGILYFLIPSYIIIYGAILQGVAVGLSNYLVDNLRLKNSSLKFSLANFSRPLFTLLFLLISLKFNASFQVKSLAWTFGPLVVISFLASRVFFKNNRTPITESNSSLSASLSKVIAFALPIAGAIILNFLVSSLDRFMLSWYGFGEALGRYTFSYDLIFRVFSPISSALFLFTYPTLRVKESPQGAELSQSEFRGFLRKNLVGIFLAGAFSLIVANVAIGHSIHSASIPEFLILTLWLGAVAHSFRSNVYESILKKTMKTRSVMVGAGIMLCVNFLGNLFLIPHFRDSGAAVTTLLSYLVGIGYLRFNLPRSGVA